MSSEKDHKKELKSLFLNFFQERGHRVIPSSPLLPSDPSLLFTTAGMLQFKEMFLKDPGELEYRRAVSCQRCLRTTDLEQIGKTARHLSYFEMLGNFSFGDYFKKEAIEWAWQFSVEELRLDPKRIHISVFPDDDESYDIWNKHIGLPSTRIVRLGDNFWGPTGKEGPCGPCTELYYDVGESYGREGDSVGGDNNRYLEYWNLVFNQFYQNTDGTRKALAHKGVDTGAGLERLSVITEGVSSVFDTKFFKPFIKGVRSASETGFFHPTDTEEASRPLHSNKQKYLYIFADHIRAINFALAENILPSNQERGYVIRRLLRRAMLSAGKMSLLGMFSELNEELHNLYPELKEHSKKILEIIQIETRAFKKPLLDGKAYIQNLMYSHIKSTVRDVVNDIYQYTKTNDIQYTKAQMLSFTKTMSTGVYKDNAVKKWYLNVKHDAEQFEDLYSQLEKHVSGFHVSIVLWIQGSSNVYQTIGDTSFISLYEKTLKGLEESTRKIYSECGTPEHLRFEHQIYHFNEGISLDQDWKSDLGELLWELQCLKNQLPAKPPNYIVSNSDSVERSSKQSVVNKIKNSDLWKDVLNKKIENAEDALLNLSEEQQQDLSDFCRELKQFQEERKNIFIHSLQEVEKLARAGLQELSERKKGFVIPDETVFMLYDSLGFPFELTEELAQTEGFLVHKEAFEKLLEKQRKTSLHNKKTQFDAQDFTDLADYTETSVETLIEVLKDSIQELRHTHSNEPYKTDFNTLKSKTPKVIISSKYNNIQIIKIQHNPVMYLVGSLNAAQTEVEGNLFLTEEGNQTLSTEWHRCRALVLDVIPYTQYLKYNTASTQTQVYGIHQDYKSFTNKEMEQEYSGQNIFVVRTNRTPCYAEAGGQVGDTGFLVGSSVKAKIIDTQKYVYKAELDPLFQPRNDSQIAQDLNADEVHAESNGKYKRVRMRKGEAEETFRCVRDSVGVSEHVILVGHIVVVEKGEIRRGDIIQLTVDTDRKRKIAHNHSAVHLVHHALHKHLGEHVRQMGSHVSEKRFRFDFAHFRAMTEEEIQKVEEEVLSIISKNHTTQIQRLPYTDALQTQAKAFFKDKYANTSEVPLAFTGQTIKVRLNEDGSAETNHLAPDWHHERNKSPKVRVVQIGETLELCGGTHSPDSGSLICVKILSETSVAQGVRRIEGIAGEEAIQFFSTLYTHYKDLGKKFNVSFAGHNLSESCQAIDQEVHKLITENLTHKKEMKRLEAQILSHEIEGQMQHLQKVGDINYLYLLMKDKSEEDLKQSNKILQQRIHNNFINLLISKAPGTILYVISVSKELTSRKSATEIARIINEILESKGGGSAAYASGKLRIENASVMIEKTQKTILEAIHKYIAGK